MDFDSPETITREAVFHQRQRLAHWLIAIGVIFQLASAWLIQHSDVDVVAWLDWHTMVGQALIPLLGYRVFLLFRKGSGHWRLLVPTREQRHIVQQTLRFYASLGRLQCPDWYAFNPVWQPIYLLVIGVLLLTTLSGMLLGSYLFPFGFTLPQVHGFLAMTIFWFLVLHLLFSILHDIKGRGAQISAMLSGFKYFHIRKAPTTDKLVEPSAENSVSLDSLLKK